MTDAPAPTETAHDPLAGAVELASETLRVAILPVAGAAVHAIVDRETGVDLLWKTPWQGAWEPGASGTSRDRWVGAALGGWQLLLPNAGDEGLEQGRVWGFHGEAGLRAWSVDAQAPDRLDVSLALDTAPLAVRRAYRLDGDTLSITTGVSNRSGDEVEFLWGEHPAFSEAFASGATLEIDARTVSVHLATNAPVAAGDHLRWADVGGPDGTLRTMPGPDARRQLLAYLDGLDTGTYRLSNAALGVAVRMDWPLDLFPCVWLWQEFAATAEAPWDGRTYAVGIEPQVAFPAVGMTEIRRRGGRGLRLPAGDTLSATVSLTVEHLR